MKLSFFSWKDDYKRNQKLFEDTVISPKMMEDKEREHLRMKGLHEEARLNIARIQVDITALQNRITQLDNQYKQQAHELQNQLQSAMSNYWEQ